MRIDWLSLLALSGCGAALSTDLTMGVQVSVPGYPFTVTTANETAQSVNDDGRLGAAPAPTHQQTWRSAAIRRPA